MTNKAHKIAPLPALQGSSLWGRSFQSLLWTNWLTAVNDNVFRWLVIGIGKDYFDPADHGQVLMYGSACFVLPYILFAAPAGYLADRFSKRNVIVACKFAEIIVMILGALAIFLQSFPLLLFAVFLMGMQSALFSPSKVGMIPEIVGPDKISKANGFFNLASLSATILGMSLGGFLSDATGYRGVEYNLALPAIVTIGLAVVGTIVSLFMRKTPIANPTLKFPLTVFSEVVRDIRTLVSNKALFGVSLGVIFFWAIAALFQMNLDAFTTEGGGIAESQRTPLLVSLVLGVGIGSVLAGFFSCGRIELGLVPWGIFGIIFFCFLLFFSPVKFIGTDAVSTWNLVIVCGLLAMLGISSGFFDVPLASYLQHRSPLANRGAILAAVNCLIFTAMLLISFVYGFFRNPVYEGKFENIPQELQFSSLDPEQSKEYANRMLKYPRTDQPIEEFVGEIDDSHLRNVVLAKLIWEDVEEKKNAIEALEALEAKKGSEIPEDLAIDFESYKSRFDESTQLTEIQTVQEAYRQSGKLPLLSSRAIFLLLSIATIPVLIFAVYWLQKAMVRIALWWFMRTIYRVRIHGYENIPENGGAVLVSNHTSLVDGMLFLLMTSRKTRMLAWAGNFDNPITRFLAGFSSTILITGGPKSIQRGLAEARKSLARGELVGIFPEGGLSRTGGIQSFRPGLMKILEHMPVPIVPVYVDEMWGSNLSCSGTTILRIPEKIRRPLTVHIGKPFRRSETENPKSTHSVRQAVQKLGATAVEKRQSPFVSPVQRFIRSAKKRKGKLKVGCSTGQEATGGQLLMRALILRRLLNRHVLDSRDSEMSIGILLPPSFGAVAVNLAIGMDRRTAVNLNYTVTSEILNECIAQAGIKKVLTSKKVWEKFDYKLDCQIEFLDDLKTKVTLADKLICALQAFATPAGLLESFLGLNHSHPDDVLTIIFTSGSTGIPKGVMLTNQNVSSNVEAIGQVINLTRKDTMVGILPFFHSFGYTVTLWGAMGLDVAGVYHFNPLDAKQIGKLTRKYKGTVLLGTPTFLRSYVRRVTQEEFSTLDTVVAGAEKLPTELCDAFEQKFGVRPVEGYGTTELSPLVSVNVPPARSRDNFQIDCKEGTVGRPIPNVAAKITDLDDEQHELDANQPGMLWIRGPNVMQGYLNKPEATKEVIHDGWYKTGDVALIDSDGFIKITGRISRFSKIGGEMIPHVRIEEALNSYVGDDMDNDGDIDQMKIAVAAVPHAKKGERLIVVHTKMSKSPDELCKMLSGDGFPNIFIPSLDSFMLVDELPMLGSGKLDLKKLKDVAMEKFGK